MPSVDPENQTKKNTGVNYEILTQSVFQKIVDQHFPKSEVKRNIILKGKTASHQIDVFWEYEMNGIPYQTIIQTKDWSTKVKLEQLLTFQAVLDDLPGQPKGVFVTKTGFQSGASEFAEKNGIVLYELHEPRDEDFEGQISVINMSLGLSSRRLGNLEITIDPEWLKNEQSDVPHVEGKYQFPLLDPYNEVILFDENDSRMGSINEIFSSVKVEKNSSIQVSKKFSNAYVIDTSKKDRKVKISEITCRVNHSETHSEINIDLDKMVKFTMKDVQKDNIEYIY